MDCRPRFRRLGGRSLRLVDAVGAAAGSSGASLCPNRRNLRRVLPVPDSEMLPSGVERRLLLHRTTQRRPQPPPQPAKSISPAAGASLGVCGSAYATQHHLIMQCFASCEASSERAVGPPPWTCGLQAEKTATGGSTQQWQPTCRSLCPGRSRSRSRCLAACPPRCPSPARSGGWPPGGRRAGRRSGCGARCSAGPAPGPLLPHFAVAAVPPAAWAEGS